MQIGATAGWEIARTAWRRNRRRGLAFGVALGVNGLVILGFVASIHTVMQRDGRAITVMIVPPFEFNRIKPTKQPDLRPATQTARVHAAAPTLAPTPLPAPLPPSPLPKQQPPPAAVGKWTPTPDLHSQLVDQPSAQRYLRAGAACSKGELWKLSREEQDKCLDRWAKVMPKDADGMHRRPPPPDPDGEFSRAAAALEEQRRPMPSGPIGQCDIDVQGSNLHRFCAPSGRPH